MPVLPILSPAASCPAAQQFRPFEPDIKYIGALRNLCDHEGWAYMGPDVGGGGMSNGADAKAAAVAAAAAIQQGRPVNRLERSRQRGRHSWRARLLQLSYEEMLSLLGSQSLWLPDEDTRMHLAETWFNLKIAGQLVRFVKRPPSAEYCESLWRDWLQRKIGDERARKAYFDAGTGRCCRPSDLYSQIETSKGNPPPPTVTVSPADMAKTLARVHLQPREPRDCDANRFTRYHRVYGQLFPQLQVLPGRLQGKHCRYGAVFKIQNSQVFDPEVEVDEQYQHMLDSGNFTVETGGGGGLADQYYPDWDREKRQRMLPLSKVRELIAQC